MSNSTTADPFDLTGRHVLVTGGYKGLGRAMAEAIGHAGARVTITARNRKAVEQAAGTMRHSGIDAVGVVFDVTKPAEIHDGFTESENALGPVSSLVNNAGVSVGATALETSLELWRTVMDTNIDGVWNCSRELARRLQNRNTGGTIVNIGSISAEIVNRPRWQAPYLASKAAVHQLTKALAAEWADAGIRVNAIAPGYFLTEMSPVDQPEYYEYCVAPAALKRYGLPEELGPAAIFLIGEASSFMTGSIMTIDGGYTLF